MKRATRLLFASLVILSAIPFAIPLLLASPNQLSLRNAIAANPSAINDVLDDFNRPGPEPGSNWSSTQATLANNQLKGDTDSHLYWQQSFEANQWVGINIVQLPRCNRVDLYLKASDNTHLNGLVDVSYDTCASPQLLIYSYNPKYGHHSPFSGINVALGAGDVFSASVSANHVVVVFINGTAVLSDVLASDNAGFDVGRAGQIGMGIGSSDVVVDDFDGGSLDGPTPLPSATPAPSTYDQFVFLPLVSVFKLKN